MKFLNYLNSGLLLFLAACASTPENGALATQDLYSLRSGECHEASILQETQFNVPGGGGGGSIIFGSVFTIDIQVGNNPYVYADCMLSKGFPVILPKQKVRKTGHFVSVPAPKGLYQLRWSGGKP